jgi:hypothetical protein
VVWKIGRVINDTIQGNASFGRPFDPERQQEVLENCALLC